VKGLAEAEALLANPYAKGVYAKLGEPNEERGLKQLASDETRVATIGGRQCRATNKDGKRYFLNFDIADEYLCDVDVPIRVTIEYYDLGTGKFDFRYDSTDTSALDLGVRKTPPPIRRTNSKTWKTITFNLPDAKLANRSWWNADMTISSLAWESGEDVYVSSVRVIRGGLAVSAEPAVAVADDTSFCAVTARVFDAMGPAADGTVVRFTTNLGTIEPEVKTVDGQAKAVLRPGAEPGEATITVQAGEDQRVLYVPVLAGRGKIVRRALVLDRLDQDLGWRSEGFRGGLGTFQPAPDEHREGRPSMRIAYRLRPNLSTSLISFRRSISVPGRPVKLGLWVKMDGSRSRVQVALMDATGQTLVFRLGYIESEGWHWMEHDIGDPVYIRGGASDGRVHLPARFDALQIGRYYGAPGKARGEICVQDLTVVTEVPESAATTVTMEADLARPDKSFGPV